MISVKCVRNLNSGILLILDKTSGIIAFGEEDERICHGWWLAADLPEDAAGKARWNWSPLLVRCAMP